MTKLEFKKAKSLLTWVKKMIMLHPENYDQGEWCGTNCCIAGWIDIKVNGTEAHAQHGPPHVLKIACEALGLDPQRDHKLFDAGSAGPLGRIGTKEHAEAGCKAINEFLAELKVTA